MSYKHLISDAGVFTYEDPEHKVAIGNAVLGLRYPTLAAVRSDFMEAAAIVEYDYEIRSSFSGLGGCEGVSHWFAEKDTGQPIYDCLKPVFGDFINEGYHRAEFKLYVWHLVCVAQFELLLCIGPETD